MKTADFDYHLPRELVAEEPVARGASRMLVLHRETGRIEHRHFTNLPDVIDAGTSVVFNATKVIPARLFGRKSTGGAVEVLLIEERPDGTWNAMMKSSGRIRPGSEVWFTETEHCTVTARNGKNVVVTFGSGNSAVNGLIKRIGDVPLPPYILGKRGEKRSREADRERYQTVYASVPGSVAAPTAGLHFNDTVLKNLEKKVSGRMCDVVLDVGPGTFEPVSVDNVKDHAMHAERYTVPEDTATALTEDRAAGRSVLAVGTTTVRTLESASDGSIIMPGTAYTDLFIYPGYQYCTVDAILTNFHLPRSTLLMMIAAFTGREMLFEAYQEAIREKYRFYSYGDCMVII